MNLSDVSNIFKFLGGMGMFLYGMQIMSNGMQKAAGSKLSHFLSMVTDNRLMGVALGALITALIHSSSATTVMVVGFVNAGILNLVQAAGVIMGANIGTTITAWMVSLTQLGDSFEIFKPDFFAPLFLGIGVFILIFDKKKKDNLTGEILTGVGLLFVGLTYLFSAVGPYTDLPIFATAFRVLGKNPILGVLAGAAVTGVLQSSTASVSILQSLAIGGVVNRGAAIYITLGQNIGTCVTALLSSAGANRTAKRAAAIHLLFNTIGAVIFATGTFIVSLIAPEIISAPMSIVEISIFHTVFNVTNTIMLYPFAEQLVKISGIIVKDTQDEPTLDKYQSEAQEMVKRLDPRILETPAIAIQAANDEIIVMGNSVLKSMRNSIQAITAKDKELAAAVEYDEETIDQMSDILSQFLIKVNNLSLTEKQKAHVNNLFYTISDMERVGDHADNLAKMADYIIEHNIEFSETGHEDIQQVGICSINSFRYAIESRMTGALEEVKLCTKEEDEVDMLTDELREKHIERLSNGKCDPQAGVVFLDILTNLERVSDHALNIAGYVKDEI